MRQTASGEPGEPDGSASPAAVAQELTERAPCSLVPCHRLSTYSKLVRTDGVRTSASAWGMCVSVCFLSFFSPACAGVGGCDPATAVCECSSVISRNLAVEESARRRRRERRGGEKGFH